MSKGKKKNKSDKSDETGVKIVATLIILALIFGGVYYVFFHVDNELEHYGDAILTEPQREAPEDIYTNSGVVSTSDYVGFSKKIEVYGLTLYMGIGISDEFAKNIAATYVDMFPKLTGDNADIQEKLLKNMYSYKACLPILYSYQSIAIPANMINENSVCDIIFKVDDGQTMEVVEHLLHAITDVGLNYTLQDMWGFAGDSKVSLAMNEAIVLETYDITNYKGIENSEIKNRIIVQEYAYWLITSEWDIQNEYGPHEDEWSASSPKTVRLYSPLGHALYEDTVMNIMSCPSEELLKSFVKEDKPIIPIEI